MMKKLLLCAVTLALSVYTLSAQNKGDKYVGGMLGVTTNTVSIERDMWSYENSTSTQTTFSFAPQAGVFVCNNLRLGGLLSYQLTNKGDITTHALTIGPSLAYYVRLCERFYYTPEVSLGFAFESAKVYNESTTGYGVGLGVSLGAFEFQPSSHWGIAFSLLSLDYSYLSYSDYDHIDVSEVDFKLGIKPSVGLRYYF